MKTLPERRTAIPTTSFSPTLSSSHLDRLIQHSLDTHKAEDIVSVDLHGKADFADNMIIASGTSQRHVGALARHVVESLKSVGITPISVEGMEVCDWVLVDAGDVVVHIFHPQVRGYYNLEKMWSVALPQLEAVY